MYIAKRYLETRFKKVFKEGEIVPDEIAKFYKRDVEFQEGELLVDESSNISGDIEDIESSEGYDNKGNLILDSKEPETKEELLEKFKNKEDLEDFARAQGIELDRRKSMKNMVKDFFKFR